MVVGKFLALLAFYLIPLAIICLYPLIFAQFGEVYLLTSYGSIFAFFLLGAALMAIGMFISSLTENQGFAAGITMLVILFDYFSVTLAENTSATAVGSFLTLLVLEMLLGFVIRHLTKNENLAFYGSLGLVVITGIAFFLDQTKFEGLVPEIMTKLSLFELFDTFVNGVFDLTAIVYYLTVTGLFLFLSVQSLEKRRYN